MRRELCVGPVVTANVNVYAVCCAKLCDDCGFDRRQRVVDFGKLALSLAL